LVVTESGRSLVDKYKHSGAGLRIGKIGTRRR
jgi:hypothetical protein